MGAVPKNLDGDGTMNILHRAVRNRKHSLVRHLILTCGMNPNVLYTVPHTTVRNVTNLHRAVHSGDHRMVTLLVNEAGCNVHTTVGRYLQFPRGANALDISLHASIRADIMRKIRKVLQDGGAQHTPMKNLRYW